MRKSTKKQPTAQKTKGNWRNDLPPKWRQTVCDSLKLEPRQLTYHLTDRSRNYILKNQIVSEMKRLAAANASARRELNRLDV